MAFEREYFQTYYRNYDRQNPAAKMRHYREAVRSHLARAGEVHVLDIGCAFGRFLAALDPEWQAYGVDVSEHAINVAREHLPKAQLRVERNGRIPFAQSFEAITAWDVLEHVPSLEDLAIEIVQHLGDAGTFAFVVPVYDGPLGPLVRRLDADTTHIHRCPRAFWLEWAGNHFEVVDWWGIFRFLFPGGYYAHWPTRRLRRVAPAIAVVARKPCR